MDRDSYGRMRSPVTGRYISNGVNDGTYANGYSGHSVNDRMIMALEQSIQPDMNEYERQKVEEEIRRLRRGQLTNRGALCRRVSYHYLEVFCYGP